MKTGMLRYLSTSLIAALILSGCSSEDSSDSCPDVEVVVVQPTSISLSVENFAIDDTNFRIVPIQSSIEGIQVDGLALLLNVISDQVSATASPSLASTVRENASCTDDNSAEFAYDDQLISLDITVERSANAPAFETNIEWQTISFPTVSSFMTSDQLSLPRGISMPLGEYIDSQPSLPMQIYLYTESIDSSQDIDSVGAVLVTENGISLSITTRSSP